MKFNMDQKAICIDDRYSSYCKYPVKRGSIYTICGFYICDCGSYQITLKEIPEVVNMICRCHRAYLRRQSYYAWRFLPLDEFSLVNRFSLETVESKEMVVVS